MTDYLNPLVGLDPLLQDAIRLYAQRNVLMERIRVEANKVDRYTVLERKRMLEEWRKQVFDLTQQIDQLTPHLPVEDVEKLKVKYG